MALIILALLTSWAAWYGGTRGKDFNVMGCVGSAFVAMIISVVIMGFASFFSAQKVTNLQVEHVIPLSRGYAVETPEKSIYVQENLVEVTHGCASPILSEVQSITNRALFGFEAVVDTRYIFCTAN